MSSPKQLARIAGVLYLIVGDEPPAAEDTQVRRGSGLTSAPRRRSAKSHRLVSLDGGYRLCI